MIIRAHQQPDMLTQIPHAVLFVIFRYLDDQTIRHVGMSSTKLLAQTRAYYSAPNYYYAVGGSINVDEYNFDRISFDIAASYGVFGKREYSFKTVIESFKSADTLLFSSYDDARDYRNSLAQRAYNRDADKFYDLSTPAVMVVELRDNNLFKLKRRVQIAAEVIPDCPFPPTPRAPKRLTAFVTRTTNIATSPFAIFNGKIFPDLMNNNKLSELWNSGLCQTSGANMHEQIYDALTAVFESYCIWPHHKLTRHNHLQVNDILNHLYKDNRTSLADIYALISKYDREITDNPRINRQGYYKAIMEFVISQLGRLQEMTDFSFPARRGR